MRANTPIPRLVAATAALTISACSPSIDPDGAAGTDASTDTGGGAVDAAIDAAADSESDPPQDPDVADGWQDGEAPDIVPPDAADAQTDTETDDDSSSDVDSGGDSAEDGAGDAEVPDDATTPCGLVECGPNATCNDEGTGMTCVCDSGFTGDPLLGCSDIDECALDVFDCSPDLLCQNTAGGYTCGCPPGYEVDAEGVGCRDVMECSEQLDTCAVDTRCIHDGGWYYCDCQPGFSGTDTGCASGNALVWATHPESSLAIAAAEALGLTVVLFTPADAVDDFVAQLVAQPWTLVILDSPIAPIRASIWEALVPRVLSGQALLASDFGLMEGNTSAQALGADFGTRFDGLGTVNPLVNAGFTAFVQRQSVGTLSPDPGFVGLARHTVVEPRSGAQRIGGFTIGGTVAGASVLGYGARSIFNGFSTSNRGSVDNDADGVDDVQELLENQIAMLIYPWVLIQTDYVAPGLQSGWERAARGLGWNVATGGAGSLSDMTDAWTHARSLLVSDIYAGEIDRVDRAVLAARALDDLPTIAFYANAAADLPWQAAMGVAADAATALNSAPRPLVGTDAYGMDLLHLVHDLPTPSTGLARPGLSSVDLQPTPFQTTFATFADTGRGAMVRNGNVAVLGFTLASYAGLEPELNADGDALLDGVELATNILRTYF